LIVTTEGDAFTATAVIVVAFLLSLTVMLGEFGVDEVELVWDPE
jgi:hypothetical protein